MKFISGLFGKESLPNCSSLDVLFQNSSEITCFLSRDGIIKYASPSLETISGYTTQEIVGKNIFEFVHHEDLEVYSEKFSQLLKTPGTGGKNAYRFKLKKGEYSFIECRANNQIENPQVQAVILNLKDITDTKKTREKLARSEESLKRAQEISRIGSWEVNMVDDTETWSDELYRILGYKPGEVESSLENYLSRIHPDDLEYAKTKIENSNRSFKPEVFSHRVIRKDGSVRTVTNERRYQFNEEGELIRRYGILHDITEKVEAEKEIQKKNRQLLTAQKIARLGYWELDLISGAGYWSDEMFEIVDIDKETGLPSLKEFFLQVHPADVKKLREAHETSIRTDERQVCEFRVILKNGTFRSVQSQTSRVTDQFGTPIRLEGTLQDVTDSRQAEEELVKLSKFPDEDPNPVLRVSRHGKVLYANRASEKLLKKWTSPEDNVLQNGLFGMVKEAVHSRHILRREFDLDQETYSLTICPIPKADYVNVYGLDITKRKMAENHLRESTTNLQKAFDIASIGAFKYDKVKETFYWTERALKVIGFKVEDIPNTWKEFMKFVPHEDRDFVMQQLGKADERGELDLEHRLNVNGKVKWIRVKSHIEYGEQGTPDLVIGVVQDITESKKADEKLRQDQAQLRIAAETAKLGYWELDFTKGLFTFTDQFYAIFKTSVEEMGGYTMTPERYTEEFLFPEDREVVANEIKRAAETGDPRFSRHLEHRIRYADGTAGYIAVHFFVVKDEDGNTIKTFGANQDISEHKLTERRIQKALDEKTTLLAEIHHRVKNNLAIVSGLLELQHMAMDNEEAKFRLKQSINRVSSIAMVHELIYQSDELSSVDIRKYLEKLIPQIKDTLVDEQKLITVNLDIPQYQMNINQAIPLGLLLNELLTNSFKYAFNGRDKGNINIILKSRGNKFTISYKDDGVGFDSKTDFEHPANLGLTLIHAQLEQLNASYTVDTKHSFCLDFKFNGSPKGSHSTIQYN